MSTERPPVTNIIFGTMTLSYQGYGSRVHDAETVSTMLNMYTDAGYGALDTAHATAAEPVNKCSATSGLHNDSPSPPATTRRARTTPRNAKAQGRLQTEPHPTQDHRVKIVYLTTRDHTVPLESTLRGVQDLYEEGLFDEFGLSNFSVADIEDVLAITTREGWIRPTVYQGLYNALARIVETELFPTLAEHGMRFQAYNPLAGGAFAPNFGTEDSVAGGSRSTPPARKAGCTGTATGATPTSRHCRACTRYAPSSISTPSPPLCAGWCTTQSSTATVTTPLSSARHPWPTSSTTSQP